MNTRWSFVRHRALAVTIALALVPAYAPRCARVLAQGDGSAVYLPVAARGVDVASPPHATSLPPTPSPAAPAPSPSPTPPAALRLAEVAPTGGGLRDEDGEAVDWLELFNAGQEPVDLGGYTLSDDEDQPDRWWLPRRVLGPDERLVVFASGKDRPTGGADEVRPVHHWETAVQDGSVWRHALGSPEVPADWASPGYGAAGWPAGPGGIGYGDGDDRTGVAPGTPSVFARTVITVPDTAEVAALLLNMDYDDGFVAYLNGVEVARAGMEGSPPAWDALATEHEAELYRGGAPAAFLLAPEVVGQVLVAGPNVLAVQVHNVAPDSSDLTLRPFLHVGLAEPRTRYGPNPPWFELPAIGPARPHASFKLKAGETLALFAPGQALADSVRIRSDLAYGHVMERQDDAWCVSDQSTPGTAPEGPCRIGYAPAPRFEPPGGFYPASQQVEVLGSGVRVAFGGEVPDGSSPPVAGPIAITENTVLRAVAEAPGQLPSPVVTAAYFVGETTRLPVVSLVARPADLFRDAPGEGAAIYDDFDSGVKVPAHVTYFRADRSLGFGENAAARIVGNFSTAFAQKSFQFTFEDDFGAGGDVPNVLFGADKPELGPLHGFRVRNMDDDATGARMRDVIANRLALGTAAAATASQNVAVFINGAYWGHYVARELLNEHYVRDNYGADPDAVDIVKSHVGRTFADAGSLADFEDLATTLATADLADEGAFSTAEARADLDNWVDYWAVEVFIANGDWYSSQWQNNTQLFRAHPPADSRWRFVLWDCAYSLGFGAGESAPEFDSLHLALAEPVHPNAYTAMFNGLLANPGFRRHFINRFADLMNGPWRPERLRALVDENAAAMASEVGPNHERWHIACNGQYCPPDPESWRANVEVLRSFLADRPGFQRAHLVRHFGLVKPVEITLDVEPPGAGRIRVSTLTPESYPWTGTYFDGNPVTLTALPDTGYAFAGWAPSAFIPDLTAASATVNVSAERVGFTARFVSMP